MKKPAHDPRIAVIDIGSNTARVIVVRADGGHLEVLAESRIPLRLAAQIRDGQLSEAAIEQTVDAMQDFVAIATAADAERVIAVATSAVREADNKETLCRQIFDAIGLRVDVIDGRREAALGFQGAVRSMSVSDGLLLDLGGGSIELTSFRDRQMQDTWTIPLGALRMSERFLRSDPPTNGEIRALDEHVADALHSVDLPRLSQRTVLVGTGGSLRALARLDRKERSYPIPRVHGYCLARSRLDEITASLRVRTITERAELRGLREDRADSILAGAVVLGRVLAETGAEEIAVSGQGIREGIAYEALLNNMASARETRRASISALVRRVGARGEERETRRIGTARAIASVILRGDVLAQELVEYSMMLLTVGESIDFYNRAQHAAALALTADLAGFSHAHLAFIAVTLRRADDPGSGLKGLRRLLDDDEASMIAPASAALAIADAVEQRLPAGAATPSCAIEGRNIIVHAPVKTGAWSEELARRVQLACARKLRFEERKA